MQTDRVLRLDMEDEYLSLAQFASENKRLSYSEFDEFTLNDINLFVTPKDEHFRALDNALNRIIKAMPALKRIFSKPITRLKDVHNILPVESVRVINNESMSHASRHSELWGNITGGELKPKKLMTLDRMENYVIYENVAFTRLVDMLLAFVKKNVRLLKDIMYAHRDLHFNLLERTNHLSYFLAIGKLHMGYMRAQDKHEHSYERCLNKLMFIDNTLRSKLHSTVYRSCKKNTAKLSLKKTNVFRLQKDYRQVYVLLKWFNDGSEDINDNFYMTGLSDAGFTAYSCMLTVFATGHFNFSFDQKQRFNFLRLNAKCTFKSWNLVLQAVDHGGINGLYLNFSKDKNYSICLLFCPNGYTDKQIEQFKKVHPADQHIICSPIEYGDKDVTYLNLFDIDSFRRIQQIILRGMVYSDLKHDVCPFCGHAMQKSESTYLCNSCRMSIAEKVCPATEKTYFVTSIFNYKPTREQSEQTRADKFLFDKYAESEWFYRNVTPLSPNGQAECPHCGDIHVEKESEEE